MGLSWSVLVCAHSVFVMLFSSNVAVGQQAANHAVALAKLTEWGLAVSQHMHGSPDKMASLASKSKVTMWAVTKY